MEPAPVVWHNPSCSKSRGVLELLAERGIEPALVRYLDVAPDRAALEDVLAKLGTDDPRAITRTGEPRYAELALAGADRDTLLDALVAEPALIERPIVVVGQRAVVARPPELALALLPGA
ncbi:MAG: arsenate reductase (glutaredoxin) [Pseudonocardia sp.]